MLSLPSQQRDTEGGIADKCDSPTRPVLHSDLADSVEVKLVSSIEFVQNAGALPTPTTVDIAQHRFC